MGPKGLWGKLDEPKAPCPLSLSWGVRAQTRALWQGLSVIAAAGEASQSFTVRPVGYRFRAKSLVGLAEVLVKICVWTGRS